MGNVHEVKINGCSIFFEELEQMQKTATTHDARSGSGGSFSWSIDTLKQAAQPLVAALSALHDAAESMAPDELELSMQLELAANGETPVFKVVSLGTSCQIAAKFVWKK